MTFYVGAHIADELLEPFNFLAKQLKRSKSFLIGDALRHYIAEKMEEIEDERFMREIEEDADMLIARMNSNNRLYSSEEALEFILANCKE